MSNMNDARNTTTTNGIIVAEDEEEANDTNYTLSIAQKSVARAALHLGIENITSDVLYVLADALLLYMDNVGSFTSHFVERDGYTDNYANNMSTSMMEDNCDLDGANVSKRWSGHVNIFDLLHAIECCTSQAVNQVVIDNNNGIRHNNSASSNNSKQKEGSSSHFYNHWESLAEFLFGKDWESIDVTNLEGLIINSSGTDKSSTNALATAPTLIGAKGSKRVGKKLIKPQNTNNDDQNKTLLIAGWNAPFPEEVPNYPIRKQIKTFDSFVTAKHACHDSGIGRPLKGSGINEMKKVNKTDPQDGVTSFWGTTGDSIKKQSKSSMSASTQDGKDNSLNMDIDDNSTKQSAANSNKRKRTDDNNDDNQNSKRSKLSTSGLNNENEEVDTTAKAILPSYVPKFLPPFPPPHTYLPPASKMSLSSPSYKNDSLKMNVLTDSQRMTKSATALPSYSDNPQQVSNVRSALVSLGQNVQNSYWGEMKNENHADLSISSLQVKTSKIERFALGATNVSGVADGTGATTSSSAAGGIVSGQDASKVGNKVVPVKPMAKASSARASRILEGSMDATN